MATVFKKSSAAGPSSAPGEAQRSTDAPSEVSRPRKLWELLRKLYRNEFTRYNMF